MCFAHAAKLMFSPYFFKLSYVLSSNSFNVYFSVLFLWFHSVPCNLVWGLWHVALKISLFLTVNSELKLCLKKKGHCNFCSFFHLENWKYCFYCGISVIIYILYLFSYCIWWEFCKCFITHRYTGYINICASKEY